MRIWWWSVPKRWATREEYANSSPDSPPADSKPMLNVWSPCWPASASSATTRLESIPPDSSTPTGTSATIRRSTARRSAASRASCQSRSSRSSRAGSRVKLGRQYTWSVWTPSGSTTRTVAGASLRTPVRIVRGAGTTEWNVM